MNFGISSYIKDTDTSEIWVLRKPFLYVSSQNRLTVEIGLVEY